MLPGWHTLGRSGPDPIVLGRRLYQLPVGPPAGAITEGDGCDGRVDHDRPKVMVRVPGVKVVKDWDQVVCGQA